MWQTVSDFSFSYVFHSLSIKTNNVEGMNLDGYSDHPSSELFQTIWGIDNAFWICFRSIWQRWIEWKSLNVINEEVPKVFDSCRAHKSNYNRDPLPDHLNNIDFCKWIVSNNGTNEYNFETMSDISLTFQIDSN